MLLINGSPPFGVDVSRFLALKWLSVPLPYLNTRPINPSHLALSRPLYKRLRFESNPPQALPKSLESIRLVLDRNLDTDWTNSLIRVFSEFPDLSQVQLRFHCNLISAAWRLYRCRDDWGKSRDLIIYWSRSRIALITTFGTMQLADDILDFKIPAQDKYIQGDLLECIDRVLRAAFNGFLNDPGFRIELGFGTCDL